ncbi:hypothetical protein ABIC28_005177 [Rhodococcus sp. PvR044]|uniref:hypothetical protein n=1 Tax=Rhodococcus sp. PvR044 TaxID=3156402 RepID=UPI00339B9502
MRENGETLRGSDSSDNQPVGRLAGRGVIRDGLPPVFDDPNNRAFQKVRAFRMDAATHAAFRSVLDQIEG